MLAPDNQPRDYSTQSDDELVELARAGNATAYGELWRRHSGIGTSIARRYYEIADADDLVSESFARILSTLQRGGGPHSGFRPYLITTIGNVARRWATQSREGASEDLDLIVDSRTIDDPVVASTDRDLALEAFRSLPDRWQAVLWYSAVEGIGPTEIGRYLGMSPNAVSVLSHRARAGLRSAWIQAHLNDETLPAECRWTAGRLGRKATGSLSDREFARVREHLGSCLNCRARAKELDQLSAKLAVILIPALLGLALPAIDDDSALAATIVPDPVTPVMSGTYAWLAGIAVTVVTAAALITSTIPPESVSADPAPSDSGTSLTPSTPSNHVPLPTLADEQRPDAASGQAATPTPAPIPSPAPVEIEDALTAPVITSSIDPDSVRPPALAGLAVAGAHVRVADDLGVVVAEVVADAAGAWSTSELSTLSPAATALVIDQIDGYGRTSPATTIGGLAPRPLITAPSDGPVTVATGDTFDNVSEGSEPFDIDILGWPGATVAADFTPGYLGGITWEYTFPDSTIILDSSGRGTITVSGDIPRAHHLDLTYVDGGRASLATRSIDFLVHWWPD